MMFESAYNHILLNDTIDKLAFNRFSQFSSENAQLTIDNASLRKCIWLASILANSDKESHQRKVQLFGSLLYLQYPQNIGYVQATYVLFSRIGNLTATKFLASLYEQIDVGISEQQFRFSFGANLNLEVALARGNGMISIDNTSYLTTRFQRKLWGDLADNKNLAISAPTSSGKSFIIKKFIKQEFEINQKYRVIYIVPSKALINQVSEEIRKDIDVKSVDVRTAYLSRDFLVDYYPKQKEILILTPERCLKLLQHGWEKKIDIDLIFIDEIQNLEDEQGRGSLLEFVLRELAGLAPNAKLISAGPNIHLPGKLFHSVIGQTSIENETTLSPVFQIMAVIKPGIANSLIVGLTSRTGSEQILNFPTEFNLAKEFKISMGSGLSKLLDLFGRNEQNIVYSPQPNLVEAWALHYAKQKVSNNKEIPQRLKELVDFLKEEIHPRYYLIRCLESRIAFHHSKLPDIVRKEIEDAFGDGSIKDLYCTSTLMEGVNLPANNLFVISPRKRNIPLSKFEFGNLIGRAGRIRDSLYGTIFCVMREGENWQEEYLNADYQKIVKPASDKALDDKSTLISYLDKPITEIPPGINTNTIILLRQKFLRSRIDLQNSLLSKGVNEEYTQEILEILSKSVESLEIPREILRLNPSVDPFLQNQLYKLIRADGIENWCFDNKIRKSITREEAQITPFKEKNLFWQLSEVMLRLDGMFGIWKESAEKNSIGVSINQMCLYALRWMDNKSYGELIENELTYLEKKGLLDRQDDVQVNAKISRLIKIYSNVVSFICVKYLKLLVDILTGLMTETQRESHKFTLAIPTYLELGSSDPVVMQLITKGVARSVAIKVSKIFKRVNNSKDLDVFDWLSSQSSLSIKPIYNRYLRRLKLLSEEKFLNG
jgi:hypothetical protein